MPDEPVPESETTTRREAGDRPTSELVDAVADRVYELMRDDLRRLRERSGNGLSGWR